MENILEILLPLVFILAFLLPRMLKKKQAEGKSAPESSKETPKPSGGLFSRLNKMLEEYVQEQRDDSAKIGAEPFSMDDDPEEEEESKPIQEKEPARKPTPAAAKTLKPAYVKKANEGPRLAEKPIKPSVAQTAIQAQPLKAAREGKSDYIPQTISKHDLRKAVVWSEILAPPLALRDK